MKIYTKDHPTYNLYKNNPNRARWHTGNTFREPRRCTCTYWTALSGYAQMVAYENCPNCLGYGIPPIPPSELNK